MNVSSSLRSVAGVLVISGFMLAGCSSGDSGPRYQGSQGRLDDPYQTTSADVSSDRASIPALLEFTDQTAQALAEQITSLPHVQQRFDAASKTQERMILELGSIDNKTRTPSTDFEMMQRRLRSALMRSNLIKSKFMFVEGISRTQQDLERVQGGQVEQTSRYAGKDTYILMGDFMEANRNARRQYWFNFKLVHASTREIVFDEDFDLGQMTIRSR